MPSCVFKTCKNQSCVKKKGNGGVTYHRFPCPTLEIREAWIKVVQKNRNEDTWLPSEYTLICSDHFKTEHKYITKTGRVFLKKCAVPFNDSNSKSGTSLEATPENIYLLKELVLKEKVLKKKLLKVKTSRNQILDRLNKTQRQNKYLKEKCEKYKLMFNIIKRKLRPN